MEDTTVRKQEDSVDLLTLIGSAIGQLQQSIAHFESADARTGLSCLSQVIGDINTYIDQLPDDPLVELASVDPQLLRQRLHHVQEDLAIVIEHVEQHPSN